MSYELTAQAERDLLDIRDYLANRAGAATAQRVERKLHAAMEMLAKHPGYGHRRTDLPKDADYRVITVYSYVVIYRETGPDIIIVRVVHGSRDFRRLFRRR